MGSKVKVSEKEFSKYEGSFLKKRVAGEEVKSQNVPSHNFIGGIYSFFDVYTGNN